MLFNVKISKIAHLLRKNNVRYLLVLSDNYIRKFVRIFDIFRFKSILFKMVCKTAEIQLKI